MMLMVLGFAMANAQTKEEIKPVAAWVSCSGGFSNMGLAGKVDANIRYKSIFLGVMADGGGGVSSIYRERGFQAGVIHKVGNWVCSFAGGVAQLSGEKRGAATYNESIFGDYTSYEMISYSTSALIMEERIMYQRSESSKVMFGLTITENMNPVNPYGTMIFNTSLVIF